MTVRSQREALGLTQEQIGRVAGRSRDAIRRWETGNKRAPTWYVLLLNIATHPDMPSHLKQTIIEGGNPNGR